mmetsp:Transcript_18175/g.29509  ORF Transcript_18175/g.29509 Transcript_18175/m.29509 type:complete len:197 (-) Transcript_18175:64-654(-)
MSDGPKIEEVTEEEAAAVQNQGADSDDEPAVGQEDKRQNRNEKKARKAMQKLGLKAFPGVKKICVKKGDGKNLFVINQPDVMKHPTSDTFVVFGEASVDDQAAAQQEAAARQFAAMGSDEEKAAFLEKAQALVDSGKIPGAEAGAADAEGDADAGDLPDKDIQLVMDQGNVSRAKAIQTLKANDGDVVNTIMELTM